MFGQHKPEPATIDAETVADRNPSSLLIIEDALIHSTIIGHIADKAGFAPTVAHSYEAACQMLRERQFDCVTLDLGLGEHVGMDVLRHLAAIRCRSRLIVISASEKDVCDETVRIGKALDLNICAAVPKPIDLKALRETLAGIRAQAQLHRMAANPP